MAYVGHLTTIDRLASWDISVDTQCVLCNNQVKNHRCLFSTYEFSTYLWEIMMAKLDLQLEPPHTLQDWVASLKSNFISPSVILDLAFASNSTLIHRI